MDDLPFLLAHSQHFWIVALAAGVALALALRALNARARLARVRAAARAALGSPRARCEDLAPSPGVALAGVLGAGGALVEDLADGTPAAVASARADRPTFDLAYQLDMSCSGRAAKLALRVGDAPVAIDGPALVLAGALDRAPLASLRALGKDVVARATRADEAGAAVLLDLPVALSSLRAGERVVAYGRLEAAAGAGGATTWVLRPGVEPGGFANAPPMKAVLLVAERAGAVRPLSLPAAARTAPVAALASLAALLLAGEVGWLWARSAAAGSATFYQAPDGAIRARAFSPGILAALSPVRREDAARVIAADLPRAPTTLREARLHAALLALAGRCERGAELLAQRGRDTEVWSLVESCDSPAARWTGALFAGARGRPRRGARYLQDVAGPPEGYRGQGLAAVQVALLAGRIPAARRLADATLEEDITARTPDGGARPTALFTEQYGLACLRLALAVRDGRADALPELRTRVLPPYGWQCSLLLADVAPRDERARVLGAASREFGRAPPSYARLRALLLAEAGAPFDPAALWPPDPVLLAFQPTVELRGIVPALERRVLDALARGDARGRTLAQARLALSLAAFESVYGAAADAHRLAETGRALVASAVASGDLAPEQREREEHAVDLLHAAIDLRALDPPSAERHLARVPEAEPGRLPLQALARYLREGASGSLETFRWDALPGAETMSLPWRDATSGDVPRIVELLEASPGTDFFRTGALVYGVQPVRADLAPLRRWFEQSPRYACWRCYPRFVGVRLGHEAMLARRLGLAAEAARARRGVAEMRESLLRRDTAVALRVIEDL